MATPRQTSEDHQLVMQEAIRLLRADTKLGRMRAIEMAQSVLPPEKRYGKMPGLTQLPWAKFPDDILQARPDSVRRAATLRARWDEEQKERERRKAEATGVRPIAVEELAAALPALPALRPVKTGELGILRWTNEERATVVRYGALALYYTVTKHRGGAVEIGQRRLPENRRKEVPTTTAWFNEAVDKELALIKRTEAKLLKQRVQEAERMAQMTVKLLPDEEQTGAAVESTVTPEDVAALQRASDTPAAPEVLTPPPPAAPVLAATPAPQATAVVPSTMDEALTTIATGLRQFLTQYLSGIVIDVARQVVADLPNVLRPAITAALQPPAQLAAPPEVNGHAEAEHVIHHAKHVPFVRDTNEKLKLPKVLVVGGKGAVHSIIQARVGHKLKLSFIEQHESAGQVKAKVGGSDVVVAWTAYLSHSHTQAVKARAERYALVEGGVDAVIHKLELIASTPIDKLDERLNLQRKPQVTTPANGAAMAH